MTALTLAPSFNAFALRIAEALRAHFARRVALEEIGKLSDATLTDVGLERQSIAAAVDRDMSRIDRLPLGR